MRNWLPAAYSNDIEAKTNKERERLSRDPRFLHRLHMEGGRPVRHAGKMPALHIKHFATLKPLVLMMALCGLVACPKENAELVMNGRVEVDQANVGSKIGGRVENVLVEEGDTVTSGAVLIELDRKEAAAALDQARSEAARAQADLDLLLAGTRKEDLRRADAVVAAQRSELELRRKGFREEEVHSAEAEVDSAKTALELATRELERANRLFADGTLQQQQLDVKQSEFDHAKAMLAVAEQRLSIMRTGSRPEEIAMAEAQLEQAEADAQRLHNGARPEEIAAARAAVASARANAERLAAQLEEMTIRAPAPAVVDTMELHPGDLVRGAQTVAILNLQDQPWVRCYVPEDRLGEVHPGQKVNVSVDTWPGKSFGGVVRRVASQAEFTPRNVQTTEKRSQLVFEVKVDVTQGGADLRSGMWADVRLAGD